MDYIHLLVSTVLFIGFCFITFVKIPRTVKIIVGVLSIPLLILFLNQEILTPFAVTTLVLLAVYVLVAVERVPKAVTAILGASTMILLNMFDPHKEEHAIQGTQMAIQEAHDTLLKAQEAAQGNPALLDTINQAIQQSEVALHRAHQSFELVHESLQHVRGAFEHIDFNVIFLLAGMMVIVNITKRTGVFQWIAMKSVKVCKGSPIKILLLFCVLTAVLSALLDNVTTILLMAPVTLNVAKKLDISPIPLFISEILSSNIGGTATLIGDPPNIMIGSAAKLSFLDFLLNLTPVVAVIFAVSIGLMYFIFKDELVVSAEKMKELEFIETKGLIKDPRMLKISLTVLAFVILGFLLHGALHLDASTIAIAGAGVLLLFDSRTDVIHEVEWTTIFFFIGLFITIGGVIEAGVIEWMAEASIGLTAGDMTMTTVLILWASGILSAIIDNIPYTATMIPLIHELVKGGMEAGPLWWSLALGACLGGNGTIIGASANVIAADIASHSGHRISFLGFMKYGMIITFVSLLISTGYLLLFYIN